MTIADMIQKFEMNFNPLSQVWKSWTDITECLEYSLSEIEQSSSNINFFGGSVIKITIKTAFPARAQQQENAFESMMASASKIGYLPFQSFAAFPFLSVKGDGSNSESDDEDDALSGEHT